MKRTAMFVDAGYLFAASAALITEQPKTPRHFISINKPREIVGALIGKADQISPHELLRIYWYDAMRGTGMSLEHSQLALQDNLKIRLGTLNGAGQQKGVDNLLVTDLIDLARNGAISDAIVLTGDEDLRIAVTVAQSFGVRVHLLGIDPIQNNMSQSLRMDADSVHTLPVEWVGEHIAIDKDARVWFAEQAKAKPGARPVTRPEPKPEPRHEASPDQQAGGVVPAPEPKPDTSDFKTAARVAVHQYVASLSEEARESLLRHFDGSTSVPPEYDRTLIRLASNAVGRQFIGREMREVRGMFVTELRTQAGRLQ